MPRTFHCARLNPSRDVHLNIFQQKSDGAQLTLEAPLHRYDLLEDEHFDHHLHIAMFCADLDGSREARSEDCGLIFASFMSYGVTRTTTLFG